MGVSHTGVSPTPDIWVSCTPALSEERTLSLLLEGDRSRPVTDLKAKNGMDQSRLHSRHSQPMRCRLLRDQHLFLLRRLQTLLKKRKKEIFTAAKRTELRASFENHSKICKETDQYRPQE